MLLFLEREMTLCGIVDKRREKKILSGLNDLCSRYSKYTESNSEDIEGNISVLRAMIGEYLKKRKYNQEEVNRVIGKCESLKSDIKNAIELYNRWDHCRQCERVIDVVIGLVKKINPKYLK